MVKIGSKVLITVEAEVVQIGKGHGECYQVILPQKDYQEPRTIWLEPDEVENVDTEF